MPTVQRAKALGYRVLVTDMYEDRPAYALADLHEVIDITDLDGTLQAARRHGADGVLCDTTDVGVRATAYVAERLGLPGIGYAAALHCTDKGCMRRLTQQAGLPAAAHRLVECESDLQAAAAAVGLPLLVKPVDSQSGRGVTLVRHADDLPAAWRQARQHSRGGPVLLDAYVEGQEYIVDAFGVQGSWVILGIAAKTQYAENPTLSSRILYLDGADFDTMERRLGPVVRCTTAALGLRDGLLHAEFIVNGSRAVPIDVAARGGGVFIYQRVLPHVSGVDAMAAAIRFAMGDAVDLPAAPRRLGACVEFLRIPVGELAAIDGVEAAAALPGVAAVHFNVQPGQTIGVAMNKDDRPGFIVALAETSAAAIQVAECAKARLSVRMVGAPQAVPVT